MERGAGDIWAAVRSMVYQEPRQLAGLGLVQAHQERARLVALSFAFLWDYAEFVRRWARWAQQEVSRWPEEEPDLAVFSPGPGRRRRPCAARAGVRCAT